MKIINALMIYTIFNFFIIHSMEDYVALKTNSRKHILTNKTKIALITIQEASHSSIISVNKEILLKKNLNNELVNIENQKKQIKNFEEKDIAQFRELLHKPSFYPKFNDKKYYSALLLAQKFKAPILYAELLDTTRLPKPIINYITQIYIYLHNMPKVLENNMRHAKIMNIFDKNVYRELPLTRKIELLAKRDEVLKQYISWSNKLNPSIQQLMEAVTLPQAVLLSLICNAPRSSRIIMQLTPSMSGFNSFISLSEAYIDWLTEDLSIRSKYRLTQAEKYMLTELVFNI